MKRLIAVDSNACHYFMVEISDQRYHRPKYMEALYNSIEMVFKKLKYHKGKMDITITEEDVDEANRTNENKATSTQKQKRAKGIAKVGENRKSTTLGESAGAGKVLAGSEGLLQTDDNAHRTWNKRVQAEISKRERQTRFLQGGDVEDVPKSES